LIVGFRVSCFVSTHARDGFSIEAVHHRSGSNFIHS